MKSPRSIRLLWLIVILILSLSCSIDMGTTPTAAPIVIPPTAMLQRTAIPPTPIPTDTPVPTPVPTKGPTIIDDDFSTDTGRFKCDNCVIEDGSLIIGPFPMVDSYQPFMTICSDCGSVTNYKMSVDTWYIVGNSSFGFGFVLRDSEKDEDLYLAVTTWQVYNVFSYDPTVGGGWGWKTILGNWNKGSMTAGRGINHVEVLMQNSQLSITINDTLNRLVDLPSGSGQVGLYVSMFEVGAGFDNFHFEELP
jgi:hypothetical protein